MILAPFLNDFRPRPQRTRGVALVIVLAFVVLITGLIVAYFSRSMASRQLSNSSAGQTKSALLAQSASDFVITGLKREIVAGSSPTPTPAPGTTPYPYYPPLGPANAVPVRFPAPSPAPVVADPIPNLVRESVRDDSKPNGAKPIPSPAVPSLASPVNSTADPAIGGRSITKARWNSHYLIPSYDAAAASPPGPPAPDAALGFNPPDWVIVSRSGPAVRSDTDVTSGALKNSSASNQDYAIGRYAYAVYDEGGLLDMNVAGHPTPTSPSSATGFTAAQIGRKGSLALADLTQLPIVKTPLSSSDYLPQSAVDNIVGWRNFASASPSVVYPIFTFNAAAASNWYANFASNNATGFLKVYGAANATASDQALLSRQALLKLRASLGFSPNALQFMGTFSRGLEQPSYIPAHIQYPDTNPSTAAPSINVVAATTPPPASTPPDVDAYKGNNDAAGIQPSSGKPYQDVYNPVFLTVRRQVAFTRADGTYAAVGEPVAKRKFPLSRLLEMHFDATDTTTSITDPTYTSPTYKNHIKEWFGLSRTDVFKPWIYNNGAAYIRPLSEVATLPRDPDFAEMLKAAINCGSLAKGGPGLHNNQGNFQYTIDTAVDYQVLQIMANLIDQYDTDSYPTPVSILSPSGVQRNFFGVEDLPYFYRYHPMTVVTRLPQPLLAKTDKVVFHKTVGGAIPTPPPPPSPTPWPTPAIACTTEDCKPDTPVTDGGKAVFLYVPDVWNPHDPSGALSSPTDRPAKLRLTVETRDPGGQTPVWSTGTTATVEGDYYDDIPPKASIPTNPMPLSTASTAFIFSDNNGKLYREPTLLYRADVPTGAGVRPPPGGSLAGPHIDVNTGVQYYGAQIGQSAISYVGSPDGSKYYGSTVADPYHSVSTTGSYLFQARHLIPERTPIVPPGGYQQYTFRLEYEYPPNSGQYITYDEKYPDFHGLYQPNLIVNKLDAPNNYMNVYSSGQMNDSSVSFDPRTPRFGIGTEGNLDEIYNGAKVQPPFLEPNGSYYNTSNNLAQSQSFANARPTMIISQRPGSDRGNHKNYSNPGMTSDPGKNNQMRWYDGVGFSATNGQNTSPLEYSGLLAQNDQRQLFPSTRSGTTTQVHIYYEDPDGLPRRAMGAYVYPNAGASLSATYVAPDPNTTTGMSVGLPEALANTYTDNGAGTGRFGVGTPTAQSLSRPIILNRPFRSVADMGYTFSGTPWKQLDFFTPESGDNALLDVFCVTDSLPSGLAAGKVNLNTHQLPVLKAIISGTSRDELSNLAVPPAYKLAALSSDEINNVTAKVFSITMDKTQVWRGPLMNIADLVGHYVPSVTNTGGATDIITLTDTFNGKQYAFAGLSAALDATVYTSEPVKTPRIQRMRESAIRALADSGQTRVWNLMIDVVAQTGRYSPVASKLTDFNLDGETRYWVHVAIDRYTGEVIDKQVETVIE